MIGCSEGGTSIEDLAEKFPDKIVKIPVDVREGLTDAQVSSVRQASVLTCGVLLHCALTDIISACAPEQSPRQLQHKQANLCDAAMSTSSS